MRTILILLFAVQVFAALVLTSACATEDDYVVVIPDTTDGDDDVVIPAEALGTSLKTTKDDVITYCQELQYAHYGRSGCYQTYHNDTWLGDALQWCNTWANSMTVSCQDEAEEWMFWSTRRAWAISPPPAHWYGDQFRWSCSNSGGWPVLLTPNDTGALSAAYYACDPLYATAPLPWE